MKPSTAYGGTIIKIFVLVVTSFAPPPVAAHSREAQRYVDESMLGLGDAALGRADDPDERAPPAGGGSVGDVARPGAHFEHGLPRH